MSWTNSNPVIIGNATKKSDFDAVFDNGQFNRDLVGDYSNIAIGSAILSTAIFSRNDTDTGLGFPSASLMDFKIGGTRKVEFNTNSLLVPTGIESTPGLGSLANPDTGMYFGGVTAEVNITVDGSRMAKFGTDFLRIADGSETLPGYAFLNGVGDGWWRKDPNRLGMALNATEVIDYTIGRITYSSALKLATGGEAAPDVDAGGLCLKTASSINPIISLKDTSIAHGITGIAEEDTYGTISKFGSNGGVKLQGFTESGGVPSQIAIKLQGTTDGNNTTKSATAAGNVMVTSVLKNGSIGGNHGANENLFVIQNNTDAKFIVDAEGDVHYDGTVTNDNDNAFDEHDDAEACRDLSYVLGGKKYFERILKYNAQKLHDMKVVTYTPKEKSKIKKDEIFVSTKGMNGLMLGAIGELHGVLELTLKKINTSYNELRQEFRDSQAPLIE